MRLLFVSNLFPDSREPYRGLDNATLLHTLASRWEVRVLALRPMLPWRRGGWLPRAEDVGLQPGYVRTAYVPKIGHRLNHKLYARALRKHLDRIRRDSPADIVLASWLFPDACAVGELRGQFHHRFVAVAQGSDVHQYLQIPARKAVMKMTLADAAGIITRSADLARHLGVAGFRRDRLHPVYNGVDVAAFRPSTADERAAARRAFGVPEFAPVVLFVGNFLPVKNPRAVLGAHAKLRTMPGLSDARLVLVGGGPMERELREYAERLGTQPVFAGRLDADGVARAMRAASVLALPSDNEGVPNVILEAFASGIPVVASNVGGISEVHRHEFLGRLVPPRDESAFADALHSVLLAPSEHARIAEHGRAFTWQATADAYDRILRDAVSK